MPAISQNNNSNKIKLSDKYKKVGGQSMGASANNQATPSHSPIVQKKVPRQANITIVAGMTGVGKSFAAIEEIKTTISNNPETGKRGRPVFLLDASMEPEYQELFPRTVTVENIHQIKNPECRRILPINPDGSSMNDEQIRNLCIKMCKSEVWNGLAVLDDYDNYAAGSSKTRDMTAIFVSNRHRGQDIIIIHQSLGMISTIEMRNATWFRLHKTGENIDTIADRFIVFDIIKIASLIIDEQFNLAEEMWDQNRITESEWKKRRSFFLYINVRTNKIKGNISKECFVRNCKKYIRLNPKLIKDYSMMYLDDDNANISRDEIMNRIIQKDFMRYYTPPKN